MTTKELQNTIAQGEGYYTEFKRNINSDLKKEMVAFANASGGSIFLGVEDDGTVCGINISNQLLSYIQKLADECDPPVSIETKVLTDNVLQIKIGESNTKPHRTTSGFYLRTGANSQKMRTDDDIMHRAGFIEKLGTGITRIKQEVEKAGLPDVVFHYNYFFAVEFKRIKKGRKSSEKSSEKILKLIFQNKYISAQELSMELELSQRAVEKNLANLKKRGKLNRIGPDKGGYWEIVKK